MKVVERICKILDLFTNDNPGLSVLEVAKKLNLNRTTVHQLMVDMHSKKLLLKSIDNKKYCLSNQVLKWGNNFLATVDIKTVALPYLKELNDKTKELFTIHTIQNNKRYLTLSVDSQNPVRLVVDLSQKYGPLHAGAAGKLLLAYLPKEKSNELIENMELQRFSKYTITDKKMLKIELEKIRKNGFSVSLGEHLDALWAVAAPIRNHSGEIVASVAIVSLTMNHNKEREKEYILLIKDAAEKISKDLGYEVNHKVL